MRQEQIESLLKQVNEADRDDILCSECFDRVSGYVDKELAGERVAEQMPELKYHLDHCGVCREEYEMLLELARLDEQKA